MKIMETCRQSWRRLWGWYKASQGRAFWEATASAETSRTVSVTSGWNAASNSHPWKMYRHAAEWNGITAVVSQQRCESDTCL